MSSSTPESTTLHLVFASPGAGEAWSRARAHARAGDAILLVQDGVLAAVRRDAGDAVAIAPDVRVHALAADLAARGLTVAMLHAGIVPVDDGGFVDLVATHRRTVSWT